MRATRAWIAVLPLVLAAGCGQKKPPEEPPPPQEEKDAGSAEIVPEPPPPPPEEDAPAGEPSAEQDPGPETILLAKGTKQGTVTFAHLSHEDRIGCMECHHEMESPGAAAQGCHGCHNPQATDTFEAKKAFHLQCLGCHKTETRGPTTCAGCHAK